MKAPTSHDTNLSELMHDVHTGKIQLPEFQRGWTWDDDRIRGIIASLTQGYPMGAIMSLQYGPESVRFKCRPLEGVKVQGVEPDQLVLDGQQRLTSMYRATMSKEPVDTVTEKKKGIRRYYYLDMKKCLDDSEDRLEAVLSIPEDKRVKENFDRDVKLDLSTRELEYEHEMFPINIVFDNSAIMDWAFGYMQYYGMNPDYVAKYKAFYDDIVQTIANYKLPVITLDKSTPRDAVCKVFENVNTGGVSLTVFELVTASFATYIDPETNEGFDLREDWRKAKEIIYGKNDPLNTDIMYGIDESSYLTTITLYTSYFSQKATSCKRKDVLDLPFEEYLKNRKAILGGYRLTRKFLFDQYIFRKRDLPYPTQLIPLTAICAVIGESVFNQPQTQKILQRWFWCGILGEMYGGSNETRYANDIEDVVREINGETVVNRTVNAAFFSASRLLWLQTRNSAAYKGIMALIYRASCKDFIKGTTMNLVTSMDGNPDIHHIFPEVFCKKQHYDERKWNSIVNKTPLLPESNRAIGGEAPSIYTKKILKMIDGDEQQLRTRVESHLADYDYLANDDFDSYLIDRAKKLLVLIETAMGKVVADKGSEQTMKAFGCSLE